MAHDIRVLVPTSDRSDLLERTLRSLAECQRPAGFREAVVVENGKQRAGEDLLRRLADRLPLRYLHVAETGKNRALNRGLDGLPDDCLVIFADNDVRFAPDWLAGYAAAAEDTPGGLYFGGPTGVDYQQPPPEWLRPYLPPSAVGWNPADDDPNLRDGMFLGFNWAAFVGDVRKAGMFDPSLGPGTGAKTGDEPDIQRRLQGVGVQPCFLQHAMVWHYVPQDRCSPDFAIDRWYRSSILHGRQQFVPDAKTLFGVPRYRFRKLCGQWWRCALRQMFSRDEIARFRARFQSARFRGLLRGMYLASKEQRAAK